MSIYKTISKYQQSFSVDFLNKTDDLVTLKNSLKLLVSLENNEISIKPLFSLLNGIKNYFSQNENVTKKNRPMYMKMKLTIGN